MWILNWIGIALVAWVVISIIEDARLRGYRKKFTGRQKSNREK